MAQRLLSKAEFAKLAQVTKPAISKALRGPLAAALVGDRIDAEHAAARTYIGARKGTGSDRAPIKGTKAAPKSARAPTEPPKPAPKRRREPTALRPKGDVPAPRIKIGMGLGLEQLAELPTYADMTIRELAERFGTFRAFSDLLGALKTIEDIRKTHLANEETEGSLISRELVRKSIFGALEEQNKRLLGDTPRTIAGRLLGMGAAGAGVEEAERVVRELISSQLKIVKSRATRTLREPPAANA